MLLVPPWAYVPPKSKLPLLRHSLELYPENGALVKDLVLACEQEMWLLKACASSIQKLKISPKQWGHKSETVWTIKGMPSTFPALTELVCDMCEAWLFGYIFLNAPRLEKAVCHGVAIGKETVWKTVGIDLGSLAHLQHLEVLGSNSICESFLGRVVLPLATSFKKLNLDMRCGDGSDSPAFMPLLWTQYRTVQCIRLKDFRLRGANLYDAAKFIEASEHLDRLVIHQDSSISPDELHQFLRSLPDTLRHLELHAGWLDGHAVFAFAECMADTKWLPKLSGIPRLRYWEHLSKREIASLVDCIYNGLMQRGVRVCEKDVEKAYSPQHRSKQSDKRWPS